MQTQMLIGAKFEAGTETAETILNPKTEEAILQLPEASAAQIDAAADAAETAFKSWSRTTPQQRSQYLLKIADAIEKDAEGFAALEALNCGKPYNAVLNDEIPAIVDCWRFFAGAVRTMPGQVSGEYLPGHTSMIRRDPIGIVGSIAPWNYPLMMMAWKLAPAIAGGNTVVFKPSEQTPLTALKMAKAAGGHSAGRRRQCRAGARRERRQCADQPSEDQHDFDHRRCGDRQEGAAGGGQKRQAHASGAWRQGAGHRVRRRRY